MKITNCLINCCLATILWANGTLALAEGRSLAAAQESANIPLPDVVRPDISALQDQGIVKDGTLLDHMHLLLRRANSDESEYNAALKQMSSPSPMFGHWLTAAEFKIHYGASNSDQESVAAWLRSKGFRVTAALSGRSLEFDGTAGAFRQAFGAEFHIYRKGRESFLALDRAPVIPRALATSVETISSVSSRFSHPLFHKTNPKLIASLSDDTSPNHLDVIGGADWATIYNLKPLLDRGITGKGQVIAIVARSRILESDWRNFRSMSGLSKYTEGALQQIVPSNCTDPGFFPGDMDEASIDAQWASAAAPDAKIVVVACASTAVSDGILLSEAYVVNALSPDVMSMSFGLCERDVTKAYYLEQRQLMAQAALEGISVVVAAGDFGSNGCASEEQPGYLLPENSGLSTNFFAATPFSLSAGGTDFADRTSAFGGSFGGGLTSRNPAYFSDKRSGETAKSYVPEMAWNETCGNPFWLQLIGQQVQPISSRQSDLEALLGTNLKPVPSSAYWDGCYAPGVDLLNYVPLIATGGGVSQFEPRPDWQQNLLGIPNTGGRLQPDLSAFASAGYIAGHALFFCNSYDEANAPLPCTIGRGYEMGGGTSFVAPAFAGVLALIDQQKNQRQGSYVLPRLYQLAANQFGSEQGARSPSQIAHCDSSKGKEIGSDCVFHDVSLGNNSVPCDPGFYQQKDGSEAITYRSITHCYFGAFNIKNNNEVVSLGYLGLGSINNDLTADYKPAYPATAGFDLATGLGTPNVTNLVSQW